MSAPPDGLNPRMTSPGAPSKLGAAPGPGGLKAGFVQSNGLISNEGPAWFEARVINKQRRTMNIRVFE